MSCGENSPIFTRLLLRITVSEGADLYLPLSFEKENLSIPEIKKRSLYFTVMRSPYIFINKTISEKYYDAIH